MHIGQISELSSYSQRMIRFLEDQGLISPHRSDSNIRKFSDADLTRILRIKRFKELGFTYVEIKDLIDKEESFLAEKGAELLKRHHADAHELLEKIHQLEKICYGQIKTMNFPEKATSLAHPQRTAYRIKKLDAVVNSLKTNFPDSKQEVILWKFKEFLNIQDSPSAQEIEVIEIFRGSSQIVILDGASFLKDYESAWADKSLPFNSNHIGKFPFNELNEFFGNYEIVIEHKVWTSTGELKFHALLPYQAIFIASGEAVI